MAKFGEYVLYNGFPYKVVGVSADETPTYMLEPTRKVEKALTKTVTSSQIQSFLVPSGGDIISSVAEENITRIGTGTAVAQAVEDGMYRVTFDTLEGSEIPYQDVEKDANIVKPTDPIKENYTFVNWYYASDGSGTAVNFSTKKVTDDVVIYAKWVVNTYTVTYDSKEGSEVPSEEVNYGEVATKPTDPIKENYTFVNWFTDDDDFLEEYDFATVVTSDITLYAKWEGEE